MAGNDAENRGWCFLDGELLPISRAALPVDDPAVTTGWAVFETLVAGHPAMRVDVHLARLARSAAAAAIAMPDPAVLAAEIDRAARTLGLPARVRITLTGGGRRLVTAMPLDLARLHAPIRAVRGVHRDDPVLGGAVKHTSRAPWVVAVKRSGVDEVLLVDAAGRFTEGTTCAIAAVIGGVFYTAPHDGRILESTTVCEVIERAKAAGVEVRREGPPASGPWDALYVCSTTRDLAPVVALDGAALPGWDPVGRALVQGRRTGAVGG